MSGGGLFVGVCFVVLLGFFLLLLGFCLFVLRNKSGFMISAACSCLFFQAGERLQRLFSFL